MKLSKAINYLKKDFDKPGSVPINRLKIAQAAAILAIKDMIQRVGDVDV